MNDIIANSKVSIIMPAYNSEKYVAEAIESVIEQTYCNWELLAVDDGSTDTTGEIIDSYAAKDIRIKAFHTENRGVSHARNLGIDHSTGEWIVFLDSDDILPVDAINLMYENSFDVDVVAGNYILIPDKTKMHQIKQCKVYTSFSELAMQFKDVFFIHIFSSVWGKMIKSNVIDNYFPEEYSYGEDTLFFANLARNIGRIRLIDSPVYLYRIDNCTSLPKHFYTADLSVFEKITNIYVDLLGNQEITIKMYAYYLNILINKIDMLFMDINLSDSNRKDEVAKVLNTDLLHKIPVIGLPLTPRKRRKAAILQIGYWDIIKNEFSK